MTEANTSNLYNAVCGRNIDAEKILDLLNLKQSQIKRFRDAIVKNNEIIIFTRTGGDNRKSYPQEAILKHPNYLKNRDDDYDNTYAYFYFSIPEGVEISDIKENKNFGVKGILDAIELLKRYQG